MYQRILVSIDDSPTSHRALREAVALANDQHAKLRIVYVVDEVALYGEAPLADPFVIEKEWVRMGREILTRAQRAAHAFGLEAEIKLLETEKVGEGIADAIVAEAVEWKADLVVAGTHGRSGLTHLLMGSVAEGILRTSPVPMLLVHDRRPKGE